MPEPVPTREQARHLLARVFGPNQEYSILEGKHGWVCQQMVTPEEQAQWGMGLGNYVINKHTGVITAHSSMAMPVIAAEFDQTTEAGLPPQGYQVFPKQRRIRLTRISEDPNTIVYRVHLTFLETPNDPGITQEVEITKNPIRHRPTDRVSAVATSWASMQSRTTGTWPAEGTIEE
ncbi:hypothetical protein [Nocardia neocaledoniensis]|jgi:hypothetical protein|uniref:hypothetical protein n=1 Tax=Nocardia neocaledoniensis TaxID=236511 RepID=UPI002456C742|nr:hypothetical protein [Nocardia neocaledoniensis]